MHISSQVTKVSMDKECKNCHQFFPAIAMNFYRDRGKPDGLMPYCKTCDLALRRARYVKKNPHAVIYAPRKAKVKKLPPTTITITPNLKIDAVPNEKYYDGHFFRLKYRTHHDNYHKYHQKRFYRLKLLRRHGGNLIFDNYGNVIYQSFLTQLEKWRKDNSATTSH